MNSKCLSFLSTTHFLFYILIFLVLTTISSSYGGNETDLHALLKIKSMITKDPYGALASWNSSLHFCDWTGVTCGKRLRRVAFLRLISQGLEGSLSPHVGNLSFLRTLSLFNNSLHGEIPHEVTHLSRLRFFSLYNNKFSLVIPINISSCSNLDALDLSNNELIGSIPKEIGSLSKLAYLSLGYNKLTGGMSPFLGNLTLMELFSFSGNALGKSIPETLGRWKNLREFYCSQCNLTGVIPHSFYNHSLLTVVAFADNQLIGSLPPALGVMFPNLFGFHLPYNQLTGSIPSSISNCSRLASLQLGFNKFSGKLTIDFAKLRDIRILQFSDSVLGGKEVDEMQFIESFKNCTRLEKLDLAFCNFQGVLPRSIGNLSIQLDTLYLVGNHLHGNLPKSIGNLVGMEMLSLEGNQFTGNIPSTIGNLQKIKVIYLNDNQLSGQIPNVMGNLSLLITLSLYSNKLEGVIPTNLGNCHSLLELYLNDNKLNGEIPTTILQLSSLSIALNLSQNNLSGSIPPEVGDLKMLSFLDLSENSLSDAIPSSLSGCISLLSLSLKGNLLHGMIPPSLVSLKALEKLDISHNNLSGQIPRFFENFLLEYLNVSYNDFEGEVPMSGVFANASAFFVSGNNRLCGGFVELGLPKCKEAEKQKKRFPLFVIFILIACTFFAITCLAYVWWKKKSKNQQSHSSTSKRHMRVSYKQLLKATNGFSQANLIGTGGFSSVYKGILDEDKDIFVAVKVLHLQSRGAQRSFMRECEAWRNIRHRNLLKLITSCSSVDFQNNDFKALVYEFMPNGSLHDWLHSYERTFKLNLLQRISILMDVASALDYIHNHCIPPLVHGDLKPSNILLDDDMVAHVGDFGLSRFVETTSHQNSSTRIMGTIGYAPPEYGLGSKMTNSGDVYSFGILLLEVMTGKKPTDDNFDEGMSLHEFASMALLDHVTDFVDANVLNVYLEDETFMQNKEVNEKKIEELMASTVKIGVSCSVVSPPQRMEIKKVVHELHHIQDALQIFMARFGTKLPSFGS